MDEIIWCNNALRFKGKTLKYTHWAKSDIKTISQLYENGVINEEVIFNKLRHRAGFPFEMGIIKKVMPEFCAHDTGYASVIDDDRVDILQYKFKVPGLGMKCLKDLSSKDMYNIFLMSQPTDIRSKRYWCEKFNMEDFDWSMIFQQNFINQYIPRKCKDFNWKHFHGLVNTEKRLKNMRFSDGYCKLCRVGAIEDMEHLLIDCRYNKLIWKTIEDIIKEVINQSFKIDIRTIMLGFVDTSYPQNDVLIINMLLSICRYHVWKMRNNIKYGNEDDIGFVKCKNILKYDLLSHLKLIIHSSQMDIGVNEKLKAVSTAVTGNT